MRNATLLTVFAALLLAGCNGIVSNRTTVQGTGPDDLLKLRSGPSLSNKVILGLPDGTALNRGDCVTELGQRWCEVSLPNAPRIRGYVSADYLTGS